MFFFVNKHKTVGETYIIVHFLLAPVDQQCICWCISTQYAGGSAPSEEHAGTGPADQTAAATLLCRHYTGTLPGLAPASGSVLRVFCTCTCIFVALDILPFFLQRFEFLEGNKGEKNKGLATSRSD